MEPTVGPAEYDRRARGAYDVYVARQLHLLQNRVTLWEPGLRYLRCTNADVAGDQAFRFHIWTSYDH
jgi:hypothetical protein